MRKPATYILLALAAGFALATWWFSQRSLVVERPTLGGPPAGAQRHENLIGRKAPAFSGTDQNGRETGTAELRGRVTVVNVWATWCKPCIEELPRLEQEIWRRFQPDVVVVGIARGETVAAVRKFNESAKLTFPLIADPNSKMTRRFGGDDLIPRTYVIDRSGVIVHQALGYGDRTFDALVSEVATVAKER